MGGSRVRSRLAVVAVAVGASALLAACLPPPPPPPPGFQDTVVFQGLDAPTVVDFAPDGRVFVAEQSGLIKVFDSLSDTQPKVFADLRTNVLNYGDRGLTGMALDPSFPAKPYVYVLYTYDAPIGGTAPQWGVPGQSSDSCPTPSEGCLASGRLSRLQASGDQMVGSEQVLVEDWCQQFNHTVGMVKFGSDGSLYASAGDGATYQYADWGQTGNTCGDPPGPAGANLAPPTAEGGSLRAQDLRTSGDPVGLDGSIIRVNPDTGAAMPDNPLAGDPDPNARRIVADGMRNPYRFTVRPGTNELWVGDVGWSTSEEINRVPSPTGAPVENFGWPCYEGPGRTPEFDAANLDMCENLYADPSATTAPFFSYSHSDHVVPGDPCPTGSSSITGPVFYEGGGYPARFQGALFLADYARGCIWAMLPGANGLPDAATRETVKTNTPHPVDLKLGPGGDLFYVDVGGTIRRIQYG
jgi:glucose/arabinose dehydrogenase